MQLPDAMDFLDLVDSMGSAVFATLIIFCIAANFPIATGYVALIIVYISMTYFFFCMTTKTTKP